MILIYRRQTSKIGDFDSFACLWVNVIPDEICHQRMPLGRTAQNACSLAWLITWADDDLSEHMIENVWWFIDCILRGFAEVLRRSAFLSSKGEKDNSYESE
jgi:hypothetical protein